jgi:NADPH2:quinone reductase
MRAIRFSKFGGPEVLTLENIDLPAPKPGQVRVRHTVIGVNFIDTYHRTGLYPIPLPSGLGLEAAGVVDALGDGVTALKKGDRVAYCSGPIGAYAEANNVPADRVVKLPSSMSDETAAAGLLKGMTVQYLLKRTFPVKAGQTILFHAAAGGVGLIASQWAKHLGAHVIGTVGSENKVALAKANGCEHVLNTRKDDWVKRVRELTGGEGVPVVYDSIGKDTFQGSLDSLAVRGMLVSFGNASGAVPAFEPGILSTKGSL